MPPLPPEWQQFLDNLNSAAGVISLASAIYGLIWFIFSIFALVVLARFLLLAWAWMSQHEARAIINQSGGPEAFKLQSAKWMGREGDTPPTLDKYIALLAARRKYRWDMILAAVYLAIVSVIIVAFLYLAQQPAIATGTLILLGLITLALIGLAFAN